MTKRPGWSRKGFTLVEPAQLSGLAVTTAPANGLDSMAATKAILAADYKGPYVISVPTDPVSGEAFTYSTTAGTVGNVTSSAAGTATDGTNYSNW